MSSIMVPTRNLVALLADVALTSGIDPEIPLLATVLLDCATGEVAIKSTNPGEPPLIDVVPSSLLIGTSTNGRSMISQAHTACTGLLHKPVLISALAAKAIVDVFTEQAKAVGKTCCHNTQLTLEGTMLIAEEDPDMFPQGVELKVEALDLEDYPTSLPVLMQPDQSKAYKDPVTGQTIPPSYGTGMPAVVFEVVGKVGKRRKMLPVWYRHHQRRGVVVEVGSMYRALFMPESLDEDNGQQHGPQVRVFSPRLSVESTHPVTHPLIATS